MWNFILTTFPKKDAFEFVELTDILHTTAKANMHQKEEAFLTAIANAIQGKKTGVYLYPNQSAKGAIYQAAVFTVTE